MSQSKPILLAVAVGVGLLTQIASAQFVPLSSTWGLYNPSNIATLSLQSDTGFTVTYVDNTPIGAANAALPRVYTVFPAQPFTNTGSRVCATFDIVFNNPATGGDRQFRFGLGNTNQNELIYSTWDTGNPGGTVSATRMDSLQAQGISTPGWQHEPGNWNDAYIGSAVALTAVGSPNLTQLTAPSQIPGGVGLGGSDYATARHTFRCSVERIGGKLLQDVVIANNLAPGWGGTAGIYDESLLSTNTPKFWQSVNTFGFGGNNPNLFGVSGGSYTVSNFKVHTGFLVAKHSRDPITGDFTLTWESSPYDFALGASYQVLSSTNLPDPLAWVTNATVVPATDTSGFWTSYTNTATSAEAQFYQVRKLYP